MRNGDLSPLPDSGVPLSSLVAGVVGVAPSVAPPSIPIVPRPPAGAARTACPCAAAGARSPPHTTTHTTRRILQVRKERDQRALTMVTHQVGAVPIRFPADIRNVKRPLFHEASPSPPNQQARSTSSKLPTPAPTQRRLSQRRSTGRLWRNAVLRDCFLLRSVVAFGVPAPNRLTRQGP